VAKINFVKIDSPGVITDYLTGVIKQHLDKGEGVVWLVPGGSATKIAVQVADRLKNQPNISHLTVTLTDERFGKAGHKDSNWKQLMDEGFELSGARLIPVLGPGSLVQTVEQYGALLDKLTKKSGYTVALAGIGPDGHIFGIKPGSPAVENLNDVIGYKWIDYQRITPTFSFIKNLDEVIVYAVGTEKHIQLDNLDKSIPAQKQPAQFLKQLRKVTIFNDYREEGV
jgi:6-phosphogluconolactonase/glucosamine-6-phosphate isomerase/deaminase